MRFSCQWFSRRFASRSCYVQSCLYWLCWFSANFVQARFPPLTRDKTAAGNWAQFCAPPCLSSTLTRPFLHLSIVVVSRYTGRESPVILFSVPDGHTKPSPTAGLKAKVRKLNHKWSFISCARLSFLYARRDSSVNFRFSCFRQFKHCV